MEQSRMKKYLGIDIGGTKCAVSVGDENYNVLEKIRFQTAEREETIKNILSAAGALCEKHDVSSVGISCGGPLDSRRGLILSPPNLPGWDRVPIVKLVKDRVNRPVYLANDADACALAEWKLGAGVGTENMIFLTFGTGLGAGLILGGRLYTGACNMAGEVGHVRLSDGGPVGYGKAGSFEGYCSGGGIGRLAKSIIGEKLRRGETIDFCKSEDELDGMNAKMIAEKAAEGDETALEIYRISGRNLGKGLAMLIDILNPEMIVIGSIFERSGELLRGEMQKVLEAEAIPMSLAACKIVPAKLGDSVGDIAAISVARYFEEK